MSKIVIFNYSLCLKKFVGLQTSQSKQALSSLFLYFILGRFGRNVGGALISADPWIVKNLCKSQQNLCTIIWKLISNRMTIVLFFQVFQSLWQTYRAAKAWKEYKWLHSKYIQTKACAPIYMKGMESIQLHT